MRAPYFSVMIRPLRHSSPTPAASAPACGFTLPQSGVAKLFDVSLERGEHRHGLHERGVVRRVADRMAMRLGQVVIPGNWRDDHEGILAAQLGRTLRLASLAFDQKAVVEQGTARVQQGWMRPADADDIRAEVLARTLDVARHRRRIRDRCFTRIDGARGCFAQQIREVVVLVAGAVGVRPRDGIRGDGITAIVEQGLAHVTAPDTRVRGLLGMDVDHHIDNVHGATKVRRREARVYGRVVSRSAAVSSLLHFGSARFDRHIAPCTLRIGSAPAYLILVRKQGITSWANSRIDRRTLSGGMPPKFIQHTTSPTPICSSWAILPATVSGEPMIRASSTRFSQ